MAESALAGAFLVNHEANLLLLAGIPDSGLERRYSGRTRTVAAQFAHLHDVRLSHLERRGKRFLGALEPFARGAEPGRDVLSEALDASAAAVARFLEDAEARGKVGSWHGPPASFLGYLIAHEAHHRALAILSMRLSGERLPREVTYGIWNWGRKGGLR